MNIITQLVILTLTLLLVDAENDQQQLKQYTTNPSTVLINSCCDVRKHSASSEVYKMSMGTFAIANIYSDMTTDDGGWTVTPTIVHKVNLILTQTGQIVNMDLETSIKTSGLKLKLIHYIAQIGQWEMRVDYQKNDKTWSYLHYNQFSVGRASEECPPTVGG